jgi:hypothetical protein
VPLLHLKVVIGQHDLHIDWTLAFTKFTRDGVEARDLATTEGQRLKARDITDRLPRSQPRCARIGLLPVRPAQQRDAHEQVNGNNDSAGDSHNSVFPPGMGDRSHALNLCLYRPLEIS